MSATEDVADDPKQWAVPSGRKAWLISAVLLVLVVASVAYSLGAHSRARQTTLTGNAYVGLKQASVSVGGWSYGFVDSVPWIDSAGSTHDSGWPACLGTPGTTVHIKFGAVPVTAPTGVSWREVVWVDCRG
jgi:hypothetical protein